MAMNPVIAARNLGKEYRIAGSRPPYGTLRDALVAALRKPFRRAISGRDNEARRFWALRDVSFSVMPGEVLGIVGRNGAGKSTLLKILAGITYPTTGEAEVWGRVGTLLEVGTGFHPELTGRENTYLSGAILGMKKAQISRRFDEIVDFAGVAPFIDNPVKHYSSGMYVRLAFAVAAHLEPSVLIVDEVLAVGDLAYQRKCLQRMQALAQSGMTILLVSHNLPMVQSSSHRALLMEGGRLVSEGRPAEVIAAYRASLDDELKNLSTPGAATGDAVRIAAFEMLDEDGNPSRRFRFGDRLRIRIELDADVRFVRPMINFGIRRADGVIVCNFNNWYDDFRIDHLQGRSSLEGWLPPLRLVPDSYEAHVLVWHWGGGHLDGDVTRAVPVAAAEFGTFLVVGPALNAHDGVFQVPAHRWRFSQGGLQVESDQISERSIHAAFDV